MKRLLVLAVVGLLVVSAGCGMTSQAADDARQTSQMTTTATEGGSQTDSQSNPHETAPVGSMLPDGYTQQGIEDPALAYQQHMALLESDTFHITYLKNASSTSGTLQAITNSSGPDQRWHSTIGTREGGVTKEVYQDGDTRYTNTFGTDGSPAVSETNDAFEMTDGVIGNESLEDIISRLEVSSPRSMTQGNTTFIFYKVDSLGDTAVEGGHFVILPNGQVRIIYLKYGSTELAYTAVNASISVDNPEWVESGS